MNAFSSNTKTSPNIQFDWPLCYEAEQYLRQRVDAFLGGNSFAARLAERMRDETATDFFEWVDHVVLPMSNEPGLLAAGFVRETDAPTPDGARVFHHPRSTLPRVILRNEENEAPSTLAIHPEFIDDFAAAHGLSAIIEGDPMSPFRRMVVHRENGTILEAVERRACRGFIPGTLKSGEKERIEHSQSIWRHRRRVFADDAEGCRSAHALLEDMLKFIPRDLACHLFFEAERAYWETRNRAAQLQKARQDRLGLGWGNHDHHTFRCSREHFIDLIEFLLKLGFEKRERYYAGADAGWGAQISEHHTTGITVFADVDLFPEETDVDFSNTRLPDARELHTVGLWVGLHGESFLEAGMHHLEARFDFDLLRDHLKKEGIATMKPFSDFEFLRQAFTEGERWPVKRERLENLLRRRLITGEQFDEFLRNGAIASHLENLQRRGGYKGFNQKAVSAIIAATDPRHRHFDAVSA